MSESIRQRAITALAAAVATIATADGYQTDAGANVRVDPDKEAQPLSAEVETGITVRETGGNEMPGMVGENHGVIDLELVCQARGKSTVEVDKICRRIAGDVHAAIGEDKTLGGLVDDTILTGQTFDVSQGKERIGSVTVTGRIHYRTTRHDPFTAAT